ncbi:Uncharacterized protein Rs2_08003 [Raphanus sativus]|nr:Uncharacterized protein Rs2_43426 [Raphanus sativus]KAJ4890877.1 Uncharacterized protein Rs2_30625 [Raphanus sativus]KAJ4896709.1 Uncharacterized protein Rs2_23503 [Raphanus sativus]KAJ4902596.1 Uncharacterized protein Rs2_16547 [Raphanus sativus]KAJ4913382.1 Uncharacterized protein Rs2_08003 [Raphanus sativus]
MANSIVFFSDLKSGRCTSVVEARLLRFWEARNVKRGGELMWMDLLMVDVNGTMMQATISAGRLPEYRGRLIAGSMFTLSGFDVSRAAQNFRLTDSSLMIRFSDMTSFKELPAPVSPLPEEAFRFRNQSELVGLANTSTQLPDVVGEILCVKSTVSDPPEEKNRVMVTMKLDRLVTRDTGLPSVAPLLRSYAKVETMSIAELTSFIVSAATQAEDGVNPEDTGLPPFIAEMEGKTYTFQVRVTAFNFTEHHRTFTITRVAEEHGRLPVDAVINNGGNDDEDDDDPSDETGGKAPDGDEDAGDSASAGGTGSSGKARRNTGAGPSEGVKKSRVV